MFVFASIKKAGARKIRKKAATCKRDTRTIIIHRVRFVNTVCCGTTESFKEALEGEGLPNR